MMPPSCSSPHSPHIKLLTLPHDPPLPSPPPCAGGGAPPNQGGVGQGHEDRRWEGATASVDALCVCVWGGGDSCRESGTGKCLVESGGGGGGLADVSVVGPEESMSLVDWWSRRWPLSAPLFYLMLL